MSNFVKHLLAPMYLLYYVILYIMTETDYDNVHKYTVSSVTNCMGVITALFFQFVLLKLGIEMSTFIVVLVSYTGAAYAQSKGEEENGCAKQV